MRKFGIHYLSLRQVKKYNAIKFMRTDVVNRIKETLRKAVTTGGDAFLSG